MKETRKCVCIYIYTMSHYIGSASDVARIRRLTQQREDARQTLDAARDKVDNDDDADGQKRDGDGGGGGGIGLGFETGAISVKSIETDFSRETVCLVTRYEHDALSFSLSLSLCVCVCHIHEMVLLTMPSADECTCMEETRCDIVDASSM